MQHTPAIENDTPHDLLARLARLDSCAVSDALDRAGLTGAVAGVPPLTGHFRIAGRVIPVLLGPPDATIAARHLCAGAVDAGGAGDVIVVAHQARTDCAGWGGNLSRAAQVRGIRATIVDGAVRDVDEARDIGYPVFATAATPRTARGRTQEVTWGEPIQFAGVDVDPGDYVVADATGVVFLPAARAAEIVTSAEEIADKEARMAADLDRGVPVSEVMGAGYERMLTSSEDHS